MPLEEGVSRIESVAHSLGRLTAVLQDTYKTYFPPDLRQFQHSKGHSGGTRGPQEDKQHLMGHRGMHIVVWNRHSFITLRDMGISRQENYLAMSIPVDKTAP